MIFFNKEKEGIKTQIEDIIGDYKPKKYTNTNNVSFANGLFIKDTYKKNM